MELDEFVLCFFVYFLVFLNPLPTAPTYLHKIDLFCSHFEFPTAIVHEGQCEKETLLHCMMGCHAVLHLFDIWHFVVFNPLWFDFVA